MELLLDYEYLNAIRLQSGLTNKAIATSQNLSESTVSRFFHGEMKSPDIAIVRAICDAIGASLDRACGLVRTVDSTTTNPAPSIPAVVADVVQSVSEIVDEQKVAAKVAEAIMESPIPTEIDHHKLAQEIAAFLPADKCASCKSSAVYESVIAFHRKLLAILGGTLGLMTLIMIVLLIILILHK